MLPAFRRPEPESNRLARQPHCRRSPRLRMLVLLAHFNVLLTLRSKTAGQNRSQLYAFPVISNLVWRDDRHPLAGSVRALGKTR